MSEQGGVTMVAEGTPRQGQTPLGLNPNQGGPVDESVPRQLPVGRDPLAEAQARMASNCSPPGNETDGAEQLKPGKKKTRKRRSSKKKTATTSEAPSPKATPGPAKVLLTPAQRMKARKTASATSRLEVETKATADSAPPMGAKPQTQEEFELDLDPREISHPEESRVGSMTAHVMKFIDRQTRGRDLGIVKCWRDCLADIGHMVRWTSWDSVLRDRFARRLDAAYTEEQVYSILSRAAKLHPAKTMDQRRGAVYVAMALGWNVFISMDMDVKGPPV